MKKLKLAVLVSGGGTNLQALIDAQKEGVLRSAEIAVVISSNPNAYAIERAVNNQIPAELAWRKELGSQDVFEEHLIRYLDRYEVDLIVLAGFMSILSSSFTKRYENRIINVHPSLIPSFCGKGYYGLRVHEEALAYGVKVTGATVHFVNEVPDGGKIILQKAVKILDDDTPKTLQKRVMRLAEWKILPQAVEMVAQQILQNK